MEIPLELLSCDFHDGRVGGLICEIDRSPDTLAHEYQHREDHGSDDQEKGLDLRIIVPVRRALIAVRTVPRNEKSEDALNQDKSNTGYDEHRIEETVDPAAMLGGQFRKPVRLSDEEIKRNDDQNKN